MSHLWISTKAYRKREKGEISWISVTTWRENKKLRKGKWQIIVDNLHHVACFDHQAALSTPTGDISNFCYKNKQFSYNFTVCDLRWKHCVMFTVIYGVRVREMTFHWNKIMLTAVLDVVAVSSNNSNVKVYC